MQGVTGNLGIVGRTADLIFKSIETSSALGWTYSVKASFLEVYNRGLRDLLSIEQKNIEIRQANATSKTDVLIQNLTEREVATAAELRSLMQTARSNRATACTARNESSSRSHAVIRLEVTGKHSERPGHLVGLINLVDLAGSESPKSGERIEETKSINGSLSHLRTVIEALLKKDIHIPFKDNKLTHLLMPSLAGNSKTAMFVNVSPLQEHFKETVNSLNFATSVNSCKMAKAKKNELTQGGNI
jgi:kinesin family protein C1